MGSIKDKVAIIGMGCTPFREHWDKGADDLLVDAAEETFASAGVSKHEVDAFWLGVPLTIDPYQQFSATLNWDGTVSLVQTFDIYLIMHGYVRRPAQ